MKGVGRSSYRITVRQLESMIRLSEGLAKLYGTEEVLIRHVTEAAYLLKTSIVHIEQEAVTFEEDETETLLQTNDIAQMDLDDHSTNNQEDLIQVCLHYFQIDTLANLKKYINIKLRGISKNC